jgi:zinc/manganese transport system substrate-binding protein
MISRRTLMGVIATSGLAPTLARAQTPTVKAVASFSILADLVRQVGAERVAVSSLVGPNGDAHVFDPSPADAGRLAAARIVFVNGLGLEGWMDRLIKASGTTAPTIVASKGVAPIESDEADAHGHRHRDDPHAWQSIANARIYVANIRDGLTAVDPAGREIYAANTTRYLAALDDLEGEVKTAIARIPEQNRRIITTHDAFGYFAKAYGLSFIAPQGVSTDSEASAKEVGRIIRQIKADNIPAVFLENVSDPRLMDRIATETGAKIGGKVFSDALSVPGGPAGTYLDMMRNNLRAFDAALAP